MFKKYLHDGVPDAKAGRAVTRDALGFGVQTSVRGVEERLQLVDTVDGARDAHGCRQSFLNGAGDLGDVRHAEIDDVAETPEGEEVGRWKLVASGRGRAVRLHRADQVDLDIVLVVRALSNVVVTLQQILVLQLVGVYEVLRAAGGEEPTRFLVCARAVHVDADDADAVLLLQLLDDLLVPERNPSASFRYSSGVDCIEKDAGVERQQVDVEKRGATGAQKVFPAVGGEGGDLELADLLVLGRLQEHQ